jgi:hypothetical protein
MPARAMTTVLIPVPQNGHTPHDPMVDAVVAENRTPQEHDRRRPFSAASINSMLRVN